MQQQHRKPDRQQQHWQRRQALGTLSTAVPITIFMGTLVRHGPTKAAMVGYLMPVFATILAVVFLGESVGLREIAGGAVILSGVWLVSASKR